MSRLALLCNLMNKRRLMPAWLKLAALAFASLLPHKGYMVEIYLYDPAEGSSDVALNITATNNNNGSVYSSANLNITSQLAAQLWALESNKSTYATMQDMIADWDMNILASSPGEVSNGWNASANSDGSFSLTSSGAAADTWFSTSTYAPQDTQAYTLLIPKSQLELDNIAGYNPETDASIVVSAIDDTMENAFTATQDSLNSYTTNGQYFSVQVPEMGLTSALFGLGALGMAGYHYKRRERLAA